MTMYPPVQAPRAPLPPMKSRGDWSLSWHGVRTVTRLELTQRLRSTRWKVSLGIYFGFVGLVCLLISTSVSQSVSTGYDYSEPEPTGPLMFSLIVMFIMSMGLLVTPTLSSTAINGDRNAGTLATLQVTLLTPVEITLGKLLASWTASLAFLAVSIPFIIWSFLAGGLPFLAVLSTLILVAVILAVVCAVSLGFSAVFTKATGSTVMSYLAVAALSIGTVIIFALSIIPITATIQTDVLMASEWNEKTGDVTACKVQSRTYGVVHTEYTWWLLALNPYVIVADAAPDEPGQSSSNDPFSGIRESVREVRQGDDGSYSDCPERISGITASEPSNAPVWPLGLALNLILGIGAVVTTVRRLRIPAHRLPTGTRVA